MDPLVAAIADLPPQSKAPHVVATIYADKDLERSGKDALAGVFMALYRNYTADGKLHVPPHLAVPVTITSEPNERAKEAQSK